MFYYRDLENNSETFSPALQEALKLSDNSRFPELINIFLEKDFTLLEKNLAEISESGEFFMELKTRDYAKVYECSGEVIIKQNRIKGIILVFSDITSRNIAALRLHEESLKFQEQGRAFKAIADNCPYPVWKRDENQQIVYFNTAYGRIVAVNDSSVPENPELHNKGKELAKTALEASACTRERYHIIVDSQRKLYELIEIPAENGTVGYGIDITEQERILSELREQVATQSDLLENSTSAIAIFGPDTKVKFFNNSFLSLWKLDERWMGGYPSFAEILEVLREKRRLPEQVDFRAFKEEHLKLFTNLLESHEEFFYLPDGKTIRALFIPHGTGGLILSCEDITDRLALERSFNTLMVVKKTTLDNLYEGVAVFGEDGRIKLSNPMYANFWKLNEEWLAAEPHISEILEKTRELYNYGDNWEAFKERIISHTVSRLPTIQKLERKDGMVLNWASVPLPDGASLMTYDDITDSSLVEKSLRERNEALEQGDALKSRFLANVSYELRSPLTTIKGFTEMLLNEKYFRETTARQKEYLNAINSASNDLMMLISSILDIASIEAGYVKLSPEEFDLYEMLVSLVEFITPKIVENGLNIIFACPPDIGHLNGDKARIKQAIISIISNSIKFSKRGGNISLTAWPEGGEKIILKIEDDGVGMHRNTIMDLRNPLKNLKDQAAYRESSASLSLSIAKSLIELHGGNFTLISEQNFGNKVICTFKRKLKIVN